MWSRLSLVQVVSLGQRNLLHISRAEYKSVVTHNLVISEVMPELGSLGSKPPGFEVVYPTDTAYRLGWLASL